MFPVLLGAVLLVGLLTRFFSGLLFLPLLSVIFLRIAWFKELHRTRRGRLLVSSILVIICLLNALMLAHLGNESSSWHYPLTLAIGALMAAVLAPLIFVK